MLGDRMAESPADGIIDLRSDSIKQVLGRA